MKGLHIYARFEEGNLNNKTNDGAFAEFMAPHFKQN